MYISTPVVLNVLPPPGLLTLGLCFNYKFLPKLFVFLNLFP